MTSLRAPPARPGRHRRRACFVAPAPASAHPLGNFTVNRYTGILVSPDGVEVDHVVDLAEIPTAQLGDGDRRPAALAARECATTARWARGERAAAPYASPLESASASTADGEGGLPVTRISCAYSGARRHRRRRGHVHRRHRPRLGRLA